MLASAEKFSHHGQEDDHNTEANLKFGALGLASEAQLDLAERLHKVVSQEVVENWSWAITWDWGSWGSMNKAVGRIHMALEWQIV